MGCACDVVLNHFLAITTRAQLESKDVDPPIDVVRGRNAFHRFPSQAVPNKLFPTGPPIGLDVSERFPDGASDEAHGSIENARSASLACENTYPENNFKNEPFLKYSTAGEGWGRMSQHIKKGT